MPPSNQDVNHIAKCKIVEPWKRQRWATGKLVRFSKTMAQREMEKSNLHRIPCVKYIGCKLCCVRLQNLHCSRAAPPPVFFPKSDPVRPALLACASTQTKVWQNKTRKYHMCMYCIYVYLYLLIDWCNSPKMWWTWLNDMTRTLRLSGRVQNWMDLFVSWFAVKFSLAWSAENAAISWETCTGINQLKTCFRDFVFGVDVTIVRAIYFICIPPDPTQFQLTAPLISYVIWTHLAIWFASLLIRSHLLCSSCLIRSHLPLVCLSSALTSCHLVQSI